MSMTVTIPQLFYDLIARILPGYLFLFMLRISLYGTNFSFEQFQIAPPVTSVGAVMNGLSILVVCYFIGWILKAPSFYGIDHIKDQLQRERGEREDLSQLETKLMKIRLKNENSGFRITKLRAEARMLEASRTGMCLILVICIVILVFSQLSARVVAGHQGWIWWLKLGVPLLTALAFQKLLKPAYSRYVDNVIKHHQILLGEEG